MDEDVAVAVRGPDGLRVTGPDEAWPVFSVTKMFVAVAVLRLAESGGMALDDEARGRVPQAPPEVTVRELLCHTTGLADYATTAPYRAAVDEQPGQPWELDRIVEVAAGDRQPRDRFRYCNAGYWLLGAALEKATGQPLEQVLAETVFRPAGMASTRYPALGDGVTETGYDTRWAGPAGATWSTPRDLVAFLSALLDGSLLDESTLDGSLLSAASTKEMTTAAPVTAGTPWQEAGYGLGLMTDRAMGVVGHGGGGPGYASAAFATPATGRSAAVVTRHPADTDPTELALRLLHLEEGD